MKIKKLILVAALTIAAFAIQIETQAQQSRQLRVQTSTNSLAVSSTNTIKLYGDLSGSFTNGETTATSPYVFCPGYAGNFAVGGFFTNSTANASNVTFKIAGSMDAALWTNNIQTVLFTVPANTTNWVVQVFTISNPYPYYGWRTLENTNAANVTARANTTFFKGW